MNKIIQTIVVIIVMTPMIGLGQNNWTCCTTIESDKNIVESTTCSMVSNSYNTKYNLQTHYIPNSNSYEAKKQYQLILLFFLRMMLQLFLLGYLVQWLVIMIRMGISHQDFPPPHLVYNTMKTG